MPSSPSKKNQQRAGRSKSQKQAATAAGELYFLGIGINEYENESWPNLNNAVRDVRALATLLQADFGLPEGNTYFLENETATRSNIIKELDDFSQRVTPIDSLIIYYAGHGHLISRHVNKRGFWVPTDGKEKSIDSFIRNVAVKEHLADINSLHTLLISDACFSGSLFVRSQRNGKLTAEDLSRLPSRWAICSGRHDETVADGPPGGHSPFAESILDVLRKTEQECIITSFLYQQVREQTRSNYEQLPQGGPIVGTGHKRGEFVFFRSVDEAFDRERVAEIITTLDELDELLFDKQFGAVRGRLWELRDEIMETLSSGEIKVNLLVEVDKRISFCKDFKKHQGLYESMERKSNLSVQREVENRFVQLEVQKKELKEEQLSLQQKLSAAQEELEERQQSILKLDNEKLVLWQNLEKVLKLEAVEKKTEKGITAPKNMELVEGGAFLMGDMFGDGDKDELPAHVVVLADFYIAKYPVTFAEYDCYCAATNARKPSDANWGRGNYPVMRVSWNDAVNYCNWLSEQHGMEKVYEIKGGVVVANWGIPGYRLPTEAEWEYAAREQGKKIRFANGKALADSSQINFNPNAVTDWSSGGLFRERTVPVDSLENGANSLGVYQMSGNIWEWCWDWYGGYTNTLQEQPTGPPEGNERVLRGGSWYHSAHYCRSSYRNHNRPYQYFNTTGFRLALSYY